MKAPNRRKTLRTMLLSAIVIAAVSCASVFLAVYADDETQQPDSVSSSDTAEAAVDLADPGENAVPDGTAEADEPAVPDDTGETEPELKIVMNAGRVTAQQAAECSHYLFKENAHYNGNFRSELIDNELPIYDALYDSAVTNGSNANIEVNIESMGYTRSQLSQVHDLLLSAYAAFSMDHPEVYWASGFEYAYSHLGEDICSLLITLTERYEGAYSEYATVQNGINSAVNTISSTRESASRYDTVKAIHDYICNTMSYDYEAASADNKYGEAHTAAPLFGGGRRGHQFVCEGYANSFKLLCDRFNIPAVHVKGDAGGPHSWNYVRMEDNCWYGVDSTWDDQRTLLYTYFLIGKNTAVFDGNTFSQDHVPDNQVMKTDTVYPLAYPDLSDEAYVSGDYFDFSGDSAADNRELSGNAQFTWKFRGNMSAEGTLYLSVDDSQITTLTMDENGCFQYILDTRELTNGSHTVRAVFRRMGAEDMIAVRTITVKNPDFGFCNWTVEVPVVAGDFVVQMQQNNGGTPVQCHVDLYIDGNSVQTLYCDNEGIFTYTIDTTQLSNGEHTVRAVFSNTLGTVLGKEKNFCVANPAFEILSPVNNNPTVSGTLTLTMKQYYCGSSDESSVRIYVDDVLLNERNADSDGVFICDIDTTLLLNGDHVVKAVLSTESGIEIIRFFPFAASNIIPASSLGLDKASVSLMVGQSLRLNATYTPFNATDEIVWESTDTNVATVKANGVVETVGVGNTTVVATMGSLSSICTVTVTPSPEAYPVKLSKNALNLFITNKTQTPSATLTVKKPSFIKKVVWCSDDPDVATVDQKGKVTGHKNGIANIYCTLPGDDIISAHCTVYVNLFTIDTSGLAALPTFAFAGNAYCIANNQSAALSVVDETLSPTASDIPVTWKLNKSGIISVDALGNLSSASEKGTVTVTASKGKTISTSINVRVYQPTVSLALSKNSISLFIGQSTTIKAAISKGADEPVLWTSSDSSVASVSSSGTVKGLAKGTATITARTVSGFEQSVAVTVRTKATGFTWDTVPEGVNPRSTVKYAIGAGDYKDLYAKITAPEECNDTITWSTSNKSVVAINNLLSNDKGVRVFGVKNGTATITAKTGSGKKITYQITVVSAGAASVTLNRSEANIYKGSALQLSAKLPKGCTDVVMWQSANPDVAKVDESGKITAVAQGETTVRAYTGISGVYSEVNVCVLTKATGFTWATVPEGLVPRSTVKYAVGLEGSRELYAAITSPENCNDKITWSTSSKTIVSIDELLANGSGVRVVGHKKGAATITAKTGSGKKITYQITVVPLGAESITLSKTDANIYKGSALQLSAGILPKGCNDVVMWQSANPDVAKVDETGKITAVAQGETIVTAYTAVSNVFAQVNIHVLTKATGCTWDTVPEGLTPKSSVKYAVGIEESKDLYAAITSPENCNDKITWSTSNKAIVSIDSVLSGDKGVHVTGHKKGTATVTAKTGSGKKISYQISVVPAGTDSITLNRTAATLYKGSSLQLTSKLPKGSFDVVMYRSSDTNVATVDENGKITARANGSAVITAYSATSDTVSSSVSITIITKATSVTVAPGFTAVGIGGTSVVRAALTPNECEDTIKWSSGNAKIATVSADGYSAEIRGVNPGTTYITAKTGSGKTFTVVVTVSSLIPVS